MSLEKHDLIHELPESKEAIHLLKTNSTHFAKLFDELADKRITRVNGKWQFDR